MWVLLKTPAIINYCCKFQKNMHGFYQYQHAIEGLVVVQLPYKLTLSFDNFLLLSF